MVFCSLGLSVLLNMFHASMGRFQLELIYYFTYFSTVVPSNSCVFISCRPFIVITIFSTGLVSVEVFSISWLGQLIVGVYITDHFNFVCCLAWAVDHGVQIIDEGRSLYIEK